KPDGIEMKRSDIITREAALGLSPPALARKFLDGPPENAETSAPAFMYVLYYDGTLSGKTNSGGSRLATAGRARARALRREHPHVDLFPYPAAMYINVASVRPAPQVALNELP